MDKNLRLQVILAALDKATRPLKSIETQSGATGRALKATRDRLKTLDQAQRDVASYRGLKAAQIQNVRALGDAQTAAQKLAQAHASTAAPTRKMTSELAKARAKVRELKTEQTDHGRKLAEVRARLAAAGVATGQLSRHEARLRTDVAAANRELDQQKTKLRQLGDIQRRQATARAGAERTDAFAGRAAAGGAVSVAAGVGLAAPLAIAGREAIEFERAMAGVRKVVNFPTPQSFSQMNREILDLSGRIPVAKEELAALVAQGARAGVARNDLVAFAEAAAKMGVAFDVTSEEAGDMLAVWRTAFGLDQSAVVALADRVNHLTNAYGGNAAKVSEMITRVGPLADVAGASSSVLAGLAQVMNSVGVEAEVGGTGIKNMLLGLTKGESATKAQRKAFAALGLDSGQIAKQMQTDAEGAITGVLRAVARLPKEQQLSVLGQLFGTESVAAIAPMLSQLDLVERNLRVVGDASAYAGSMQREFAGTVDNSGARLDQSGNKAMRMATILGDRVKPYVDKASAALGGLSDAVVKFADKHPALTGAVMAFLGVLAGVLLVFGGLALAAAAILAPFALLQAAWAAAIPLLLPLGTAIWGAVTATWAWTAALLANPITWIVIAIVAAVALLAGTAYLIYRNWGPISAWFGGVWTKVKDGAVATFNFLAAAIMNFTPVGLFVRAFQAVWPFLSSVGQRFLQFGGQLVMGIVNGVLGGIPRLIAAVMSAGGRLIAAFKNKLGIHSPSRVFADFGGHTMGGLALGIERARNRPLEALGAVGGAMTSALALTTGAPAMAAPASGAPAPAGGGDTYTFHIAALPGQDPQAIADEVMKRIEAAKASRRRSSFEDDDE